jgi:hypothetical protein
MEENYIPPNLETVRRCEYFYLKYLFANDNDVEIDYDVLGGMAIILNNNSSYVWVSFMNNGSDTIVFSEGGVISSFQLNNESITRFKNWLNHSQTSFISRLFHKIKSFYHLTFDKK